MILLLCLCSCELSYQAPAVGKMRILAYGNDYSYGSAVYYPNGEPYPDGAGKLYKTINDAVQVSRALSALAEKAGIECEMTCLVEGIDIYQTTFLSKLDDFINSSEKEDITIIYYSGHGVGNKKKVNYGDDTTIGSYLALRRDAVSTVLYPVSSLIEKVEKIDGIKIIIGDFCFSGALVKPGYLSVTSGDYLLMDSATLFSKYRDDICESSSMFCLSAARYNELSYEKNSLLHGDFTNALLEALGWDEENQCLKAAAAEKDNMITLFEIAKYVTAHDGESKQTPMVSGGSNDIVLFSF